MNKPTTMRLTSAALSLLLTSPLMAKATSSDNQYESFFSSISAHCGKAFEGQISVDTHPSPILTDKRLVMHVMSCDENELRIPFHIGDNASRTWIITKTSDGLSLKHDHRHQDGSEDRMTMYGGHTVDAGWPQVQSFPADRFSQDMFVELGRPQSVGNTWQMFIYPDSFSYRLIRQGREFRADFDLTKPVTPPAKPWGY